MTGHLLSIAMLLLAAAFPVVADDTVPGPDAEWPYPDQLRSSLAYLHPLVNYAVHPAWRRDWERNLHRRNGMMATFGSVATKHLLTDMTLNITEPVGDRVRFLYRMVLSDALHLDRERREHMLGFEIAVHGPLAARLLLNPVSDKEEFDVRVGLMVSDSSRKRYLLLDLWLEDPLFEGKNDRGGLSDRETVGVRWELRERIGRWELSSAGRRGSESRRTYPDADLSPHVSATSLRDDAAAVRVRYALRDDDFVGLEASHVRFESTERRRDGVAGFDYRNEFAHLKGVAVVGLNRRWTLRPEMHWVRQWSSASGRRTTTHRRDDLMPALFCELRPSSRTRWDLGYMAVIYDWDHTANGHPLDHRGSTDKVALGWTRDVSASASLTVSLSHEVGRGRFGGGNVQWRMSF